MERWSIVVKAYNEAGKIGACLRSILAVTGPGTDFADVEVIVADSLSQDDTIAEASRYPVRIVQMVQGSDRSCGAGAQLGFQVATGDYLLLMDGDMELEPGFLPAAMAALRADERLAGVGGHVREMTLTLEFQQRMVRPDKNMKPGPVSHLGGGGLFRMAALRDVGYLANRNLHSLEEFDLGVRLRAAGWRLARIDVDQVRHFGHATPPYRLLVNRWRSRYFHGYGEFLRAHLRSDPRLAIWKCRLFLGVIAWWLVLAGLSATALFAEWLGATEVAIGALPMAVLLARKRSVTTAVYSFCLWNFHAAALLAGLMRRQVDPRQPIAHVEMK